MVRTWGKTEISLLCITKDFVSFIRFRPMDNLSGGEKTVAALALLFSIRRFMSLFECFLFSLNKVAAREYQNFNLSHMFVKYMHHSYSWDHSLP